MVTARQAVICPEGANPVLVGAGTSPISGPARVAELARRPTVPLGELLNAAGAQPPQPALPPQPPPHPDFTREALHWADVELKYGGYLVRERERAGRMARMEGFVLPEGLDYPALRSLSWEAREKLAARRPATLGQAGRIPGVSPADLQALVMEVLRRR